MCLGVCVRVLNNKKKVRSKNKTLSLGKQHLPAPEPEASLSVPDSPPDDVPDVHP